MKRKLITAISIGFIAIISILILTSAALKIRGANDVIPTSSAAEVEICKYEDGKKSGEGAYYYDSEAVELLKDIFRGKYVTDNTSMVESIAPRIPDTDGDYYCITISTPGVFEKDLRFEIVDIYIDSKSGEYKICIETLSLSSYLDDTTMPITYVCINGIVLDTDKIDHYFSEGVARNVVAQDGEFYGTVKHISYGNQNLIKPRHFLYVTPLGDRTDIWVPFVVGGSTSTVSVGDNVKITYSGTNMDGTMRQDGYFAESVEITNVTKVRGQKDLLAASKDYIFDRTNVVAAQDFGTVVHVVRVKSGARGYLVYLADAMNSIGNLTCYWIDDNAIFSYEASSLLSQGKTDYRLDIFGVANSPYDNLDIKSAVSVSANMPSSSDTLTIGDIVKQSDISKIALLWNPLSSEKTVSTYDGKIKNILFSLLFEDKKIVDDRERFFALENSFANDFGNIAFIWLILNAEEQLSIKANTKTGEFTVVYTQIKGEDTFATPLYASAEGESINTRILRWL